jgi:hypothetical protein
MSEDLYQQLLCNVDTETSKAWENLYHKKAQFLFNWFFEVWRIDVMQKIPFHVYGEKLFEDRIERELKKHSFYNSMTDQQKYYMKGAVTRLMYAFRYDNPYYIQEQKKKTKSE